MEEIKIENLTFSYPSKETPSLKNINLTVNKGEFVVLFGKSGCGKSTLLRRLKPVIAPHGTVTGNVYFEGKSVFELTQREQAEKIGFVLQNPDNQLVCDKVWHELAFGLESLGCPAEEIRSRTAETASFFGIQNSFYDNVNTLSGGQKQLLNLAAVMVMRPSLLILDEPTSQLDPISASEFLNALSRINKELGTTVIMSEHRLEEVFPLADKAVVMENGEILDCGTVREVGKTLKNSNSDMYNALPVPMRVYYETDGGKGNCPVTVREGREWLSKQEVRRELVHEKYIADTDTVLEFNEVWFRYERNLPDILKGLSFKVHEGEFYAIIGGNGTGKSTALSVASGINSPYRGSVKIAGGKRIAALAQNPQSMFAKKTVRLNLYDVPTECTGSEKDEKINNIIEFCELGDLLEAHPYDLSGGEQQRAALAMTLLRSPDILIADEPTKGLDAHFKEKLASLIKGMQKSGVSVVMVSHDIEFCAKYADRCGMFFDGRIVSEGAPYELFSKNSFYTTSACRMSAGFMENAVLDTDIIRALGGEVKEVPEISALPPQRHEKQERKKPRRLTLRNKICGTVFTAAFLAVQFLFCGRYDNWKGGLWQSVSIVLLGLACMNFIPQREFGIKTRQTKASARKLSFRTRTAAAMILLCIPLTIFIGIYYLGDRKYYFISLMIILETLVPFAMIFEGRKPQARELVIISVLCAVAVAGRAAFSPLPQFKPVTAMVIISGICLGGETGFLVGAVTGFVSNFFFGQGPWTPWQMFSFGIIGFIAGSLFTKGILRKTRTELCVFGFFATLVIYGGIMNPASVIMSGTKLTAPLLLSCYTAGLPFDLIHALSAVFFLWFAAEPMCEKIDRVKQKYGLME